MENIQGLAQLKLDPFYSDELDSLSLLHKDHRELPRAEVPRLPHVKTQFEPLILVKNSI